LVVPCRRELWCGLGDHVGVASQCGEVAGASCNGTDGGDRLEHPVKYGGMRTRGLSNQVECGVEQLVELDRRRNHAEGTVLVMAVWRRHLSLCQPDEPGAQTVDASIRREWIIDAC
jgi:hypothetical protein